MNMIFLAFSRGLMKAAALFAPVSAVSVATDNSDGRVVGYVLAVGTDPYDVGRALVASGREVAPALEKEGLL